MKFPCAVYEQHIIIAIIVFKVILCLLHVLSNLIILKFYRTGSKILIKRKRQTRCQKYVFFSQGHIYEVAKEVSSIHFCAKSHVISHYILLPLILKHKQVSI